MELEKKDTKKAQGVAIVGMVMLHLFCRTERLPYEPLVWIKDTPFIYYLGLFGDICVPIYCFCSGYAHMFLWEKEQANYRKYLIGKILRFLCNYWTVVILFSIVALLSGNTSTVPGTIWKFLGNMFLYRINYNGAWWFVLTYIFLTILSPIWIKVVQNIHPIMVLVCSFIIYFVAYLFRFKYRLDIPCGAANWLYNQIILVGTSQFTYMIGMLCRNGRWVSKLRTEFSKYGKIAYAFLILCFLGHCVVQSVFVAPFTAMATLLCLFMNKMPSWLDSIFEFFGKHSTNIWLVHMFFYEFIFVNYVFIVKYPVLIFGFMMLNCLAASWLINWIDVIMRKAKRKICVN